MWREVVRKYRQESSLEGLAVEFRGDQRTSREALALGSGCKGEDSESGRETEKERRADGHVPFGKKRGERGVFKRSFVQPSLVASSSANPPEPLPRVSVSHQVRPYYEKRY